MPLTRRAWSGTAETQPHPDAVWSSLEGMWLESDDAFRERVVKHILDSVPDADPETDEYCPHCGGLHSGNEFLAMLDGDECDG